MYAFTRTSRLDFAGLAKAELHGRGDDKSAKKRRRPDATHRALAAALDDEGNYVDQNGHNLFAAEDACERDKERQDSAGFDPYAIKAAYKRHKERQGAAEKKGVRPVLHIVVGVSPESLGDGVHDRDDPRVKQLLKAAIEWANAELGGVFAARYDVDEKGGGIADLFCAPVREYAVGRGRTMRTMVAPAMALRELAKRHERGLSYAAMQTSWTEWANRELGDGRVRFQRGRPKAETRAEHLSPEDYQRSLDIAAERDRPWRDLVNRIADTFGDGDQRSRQYEMVKWLHKRRAAMFGEPCDPDRIVADLDRIADGQLTGEELQTYTEEAEAELEREQARPTMWKGPVR